MPANLTPQYLEAEARYRAADADEEKLEALDEMMAVIPKHKGTEKMRADIKKRIAKLKQKEKSSGAAKRGVDYHVEKEGAGQIAIAGPPNTGKSMIVSRLSAAHPEVADYPFTTKLPLPGMMEFEDVLVQLVDTPAIAPEMTEPWVVALVRSADAVVLVLDASNGTILDDMEQFQSEIAKSKLHLVAPGESPKGDYPIGTVFRPAIIAANKIDLPGAREDLDVFVDLYQPDLPVLPISAQSGEGLEELKSRIWSLLGIVRVYTKIPGKPADLGRPFTLKRGSTVADLASTVHKEFAGRLRFARAWGKGKPDGAMIGREQELEDGDVVELHV